MLGIPLLILFLVFSTVSCFPQQNMKQEASGSDKYTWDFGRVKAGEALKHGFTFKNETKKILKIKDINSSCGCTVPEVKKKELLPKESTTIEVKFNSEGYSGRVQQFVYVHTDSLDNPVTRYIIKGEVEKK